MTDRLVLRPPRTDEELWHFVAVVWGIEIPRTPVCPGHSSPFDAFAEAYFARAPVTVWHGSRGFAGKTMTLGLLALTEQVCLRCDTTVLGGSGQQSERVIEVMGKGWNAPRAPRELLASEPGRREMRLQSGAVARALMASGASVRGGHAPRLRLDECDEMDLVILDAALGQPMSQQGVPAQTVLSSTWHHADGTFTEVMKRATDRGWPVRTWCFRETLEPHGWLTQTEVDRKRGEVSAAMFRTEIELQEPTGEGRAILPDAVEAMFRKDLGEYAGGDGERVEAEAPEQDGRYATGADWAKREDWTAILSLRAGVRPARLVAFERVQRRPWPEMIARLDARLGRYPGYGCHDATGLGNVVADLIRHEVEDVQMVGRARQDLFSEYIAAIERGEIVSPRIDYVYREHLHCAVDDLYRTGGHPPDSVVAGALAWRALQSMSVGEHPAIGSGERQLEIPGRLSEHPE